MKPRIGQTVYVTDVGQSDNLLAWKQDVGYLGAESFIVEDYHLISEEYQEYFYEDEGRTWFASFADMKKAYPNVKYSREKMTYILEVNK